VLCVGLAIWTHRDREQARIVKHIEQHYGNLKYDWEQQPTPKNNTAKSPVPDWVLARLGEDFFQRAVRVHVRGNVDLKEVSRLNSIRELTIWKEDLTDETLRPISRLRNLRRLTIQSDKHQSLPGDYPDTTQIGDASLAMISQMPKLEWASVAGTGFSAKGLAALSKSQSLRSVWVHYCDRSVKSADTQCFRLAGRVETIVILKWTPGTGVQGVVDWVATGRPPVATGK
jgi:hypothetical protein